MIPQSKINDVANILKIHLHSKKRHESPIKKDESTALAVDSSICFVWVWNQSISSSASYPPISRMAFLSITYCWKRWFTGTSPWV